MVSTFKYYIRSLLGELILRRIIPASFFYMEIDVTGGFGSQLIALHTYKSISELGYQACFDLSYFDTKYKLPKGVRKYKLHGYISKEIEKIELQQTKKIKIKLRDSSLKFFLGIKSIVKNKETLRVEFTSRKTNKSLFPNSRPLIVVHVRRGDFLTVADFITPVETQLSYFSNKMLENCHLVFLTDDTEHTKPEIENLFHSKKLKNSYDLFGPENANSDEAFEIMISADILIASNSQLSLIASILNPNISIFETQNFVADNSYKRAMLKLVNSVSKWQS